MYGKFTFVFCSYKISQLSISGTVMTSIAQLIKTSEYVCTGRWHPVQASAVFLNELIISFSQTLFMDSLSFFRTFVAAPLSDPFLQHFWPVL